MRPKKRVLLIDADIQRQAVTRFVLRTWRFEVISAAAAAEGLRLAKEERTIDAVLMWGVRGEGHAARAADLHQRSLLLICNGNEASRGFAQRTLSQPKMDVLIDALKVMAVRQRGPRKGSRRGAKMPQAVDLRIAELARMTA